MSGRGGNSDRGQRKPQRSSRSPQRSDSRRGEEPREDASQRWVIGLHPVREILRAGQRIDEVLVSKERDASEVVDEIVNLAQAAGVTVAEVGRSRIDDVAEGLVHQGVVARAGPFPYADLDRCKALARRREEPLFLVALDGVTDPHNLGAIARSAEGFGAHGLLIPSRRAAAVTPVVEKSAAGALAHLPLVRVPNLVSTLRSLKEEGVWVVGLDSNESVPIAECRLLDEPLVLMVGSEGKGLAHLSHVTCDVLVRLPMHGHVGSFNASVAAAVALYEVQRRRGVAGPGAGAG